MSKFVDLGLENREEEEEGPWLRWATHQAKQHTPVPGNSHNFYFLSMSLNDMHCKCLNFKYLLKTLLGHWQKKLKFEQELIIIFCNYLLKIADLKRVVPASW